MTSSALSLPQLSLSQVEQTLEKLTTFVQHETFLLAESKISQALSLVKEKEKLMTDLVQLSPLLSPMGDFWPTLTEEEKKKLSQTLRHLHLTLKDSHLKLAAAYKAHEKLMGLCIEAVKSAKAPLKPYNKYGKSFLSKAPSESIGFTKRL